MRIYSVLLWLYPRAYREKFGEEMRGVFAARVRELRAEGRTAMVAFVWSEVLGALAGAFGAWRAQIGNPKAGETLAAEGELPAEVLASERRIQKTLRWMEHAIANHEFTKARFFAYAEQKERETLRKLRDKYNLPSE